MYALIVPLLTPFVLLGTVMGLSWLEDHVLPPAEVPDTTEDSPSTALPTAVLPTALTVAVPSTALTAVVTLDSVRREGAVDRPGAPELTHPHGAAL